MPEDVELLQAWRAGDRRAGGVLFERHFSRVRRYFRSKVPPVEIEDLVQRTFAATLEHAEQFRGEAQFVGYLLAIARSQLHRWLRKRDPVRDGLDAATSSLFDLGVSIGALAIRHQRQQVILEAMRRLPLDTQTLLELHYWEGLDAPEIAVALDVRPGTVRARLMRARQQLRALMVGHDPCGDDEARLLRDLLD